MKMVDCPKCDMSVGEIDDTPSYDGSKSITKCRLCGNVINI